MENNDVFAAKKDDNKTITDRVMHQLLQHVILSGQKPGSLLPSERELCRSLSISRLPLREALAQMKILGIIKSVRGSGNRLCDINTRNLFKQLSPILCYQKEVAIEDILQTIKMLETTLAQGAAFSRKKADVGNLRECVKRLKRKPDDKNEIFSVEMEFLSCMGLSMENPLISMIMELVQAIFFEMKHLLPDIREYSDISIDFHENLLHAIERKDVQKAGMLVENYIDKLYVRIVSGACAKTNQSGKKKNETDEIHDMVHL